MENIREHYKAIYICSLIFGLSFLLFYFKNPSRDLGFFLLGVMMICGIYMTGSLVILSKKLTHKISKIKLFFGLFLIIGGASFDIINTIIFSPDLSQEGNPIALFMLKHKVSLHYIYVAGIIGQSLITVLSVLVLVIFLKSYPLLLQALNKSSSQSFVRTILGGYKATYLDIIIGKVDPFFAVTTMAPMLIGSFFYRWYLGLEWLQLVPISRVLVPSFILLSSLTAYLLITHRNIKLLDL